MLPRFGNRVILIDVGLSKLYGGAPACLMVEQSKLLHRGRQLELKMAKQGRVDYLKAAAALDPTPSPLEKLIQSISIGETLVPSQDP